MTRPLLTGLALTIGGLLVFSAGVSAMWTVPDTGSLMAALFLWLASALVAGFGALATTHGIVVLLALVPPMERS